MELLHIVNGRSQMIGNRQHWPPKVLWDDERCLSQASAAKDEILLE